MSQFNETSRPQISPFKMGERVTVKGDRGYYVVKSDELASDGSVLVFGGSVDPNASRKFRSVMPHKLVVDKRKQPKA